MGKLPISIGILAWHSGQTLVDTLESYYKNGLFDIVDDVTILFQEVTEEDKLIAKHFNLPIIGETDNIGIGKAFYKLTDNSKNNYVLLLEHDWHLIEDIDTTRIRLMDGINLIGNGFKCVRYRHRETPGIPHFSFSFKGRELDYYDSEIQAYSPHLLDSIHWLDPDKKFPDKFKKDGEYVMTTSKWANFTNNPCMYDKHFYESLMYDFSGNNIELEGKISKWWNRQNFKVAQGEGLFCHVDNKKYGN